ncbi:MAG: hypothetical protein AAGG48_18830 [Planctomycetota bacterium]
MKRLMTLLISLASVPAIAQPPSDAAGSGFEQPRGFYGNFESGRAAAQQNTGSSGLNVPADNGLSATPKQKPGNPFRVPTNPGLRSGGGAPGMDMGMGDMADFDDMEEMFGYGAMGSTGAFDPEDFFRRALQRAIRGLREAENDDDRTTIKGYIKTALEERYSRMIKKRREDLEGLKAKIQKLEQDLKRRESAAKRVIEVQMQSVELASEGLLELGELRGVKSRGGGMGMRGGMEDGTDMMDGGMGGMMGSGSN